MTTLLKTASQIVLSDRRFNAPSVEREAVVAAVTQGHQFNLLSAPETSQRIRELAETLKKGARAASKTTSCAELSEDHPLLVLREVLILILATDAAATELMIERARRSKRFSTYLNADDRVGIFSGHERLADAMRTENVRQSLLLAGLAKEQIDELVSSLTLSSTKRFIQIFGNEKAPEVFAEPSSQQTEKRGRGRPRKVRAVSAETQESAEPLAAAPDLRLPVEPTDTAVDPLRVAAARIPVVEKVDSDLSDRRRRLQASLDDF